MEGHVYPSSKSRVSNSVGLDGEVVGGIFDDGDFSKNWSEVNVVGASELGVVAECDVEGGWSGLGQVQCSCGDWIDEGDACTAACGTVKLFLSYGEGVCSGRLEWLIMDSLVLLGSIESATAAFCGKVSIGMFDGGCWR